MMFPVNSDDAGICRIFLWWENSPHDVSPGFCVTTQYQRNSTPSSFCSWLSLRSLIWFSLCSCFTSEWLHRKWRSLSKESKNERNHATEETSHHQELSSSSFIGSRRRGGRVSWMWKIQDHGCRRLSCIDFCIGCVSVIMMMQLIMSNSKWEDIESEEVGQNVRILVSGSYGTTIVNDILNTLEHMQ